MTENKILIPSGTTIYIEKESKNVDNMSKFSPYVTTKDHNMFVLCEDKENYYFKFTSSRVARVNKINI